MNAIYREHCEEGTRIVWGRHHGSYCRLSCNLTGSTADTTVTAVFGTLAQLIADYDRFQSFKFKGPFIDVPTANGPRQPRGWTPWW